MTPLLRTNSTTSATVAGDGIGLPFAVVPCSVLWAPDGPFLYYTARGPRAPRERTVRRAARPPVGNISAWACSSKFDSPAASLQESACDFSRVGPERRAGKRHACPTSDCPEVCRGRDSNPQALA